jgi:hypothetical protein
LKYPDGTISTLGAHAGLDDCGAALERLRGLLDSVKEYRKHAYYESIAILHLELAQAMERTWHEFEGILEEIDE